MRSRHRLVTFLCSAIVLASTAAEATPSPAHTDDLLVFKRGTLSMGGGVGLTLRHDAYGSFPSTTKQLADGSTIDVPGAEWPNNTYFALALMPQFGSFVSPHSEVVVRLHLTFEAGVPTRSGTEMRVGYGGGVGVNFYTSQTRRLRFYFGLYGGFTNVGGARNLQLEAGPGLLIALGRSLALRLAAPLRLAVADLGGSDQLILEWTPMLGLAVFL